MYGKGDPLTARDFCFWLQGHLELNSKKKSLTGEQLELIKNHLNLVFIHEIDPSMGNQEHQDKLNEVHNKINKLEHKIEKIGWQNQPMRC